MRALVVDDSRVMRLILSRMLQKSGCDVDEAPDGPTALAYVQAGGAPDLILVDWHMPGMLGIDFVKAVRQAPFDYTGRLLMVTTETQADQVALALDAGADEYLMKPFTEEALADKLLLLGLGT